MLVHHHQPLIITLRMPEITRHHQLVSKKTSFISLSRFTRKLLCVSRIASPLSPPSSAPSCSDEKQSIAESEEQHSPASSTVTFNEEEIALADFLATYPEYLSTWMLDSLRRSDYTRLSHTGETYVDYMGGSLYPESLVRIHSAILTQNVMGNTHSISNRY